MAQDPIRTFLAIELSEAIRKEAHSYVEVIEQNCPDFRFIPPENWHLTLHFFGQIDSNQIQKLETHLPPAFSSAQPFSIQLEKLGAFPSWNQARILWIGVGGDVPQLLSLIERLNQVLQEMHFEIEPRDYSPHITIARLKTRNPVPAAVPKQTYQGHVIDRVQHITLFRSDLSSKGAYYSPIKTFPFGVS